MLHILSKRIAFLVCEKTDLLPLEIYVYGFELIISSIIETGALLLVGFLIGKFVETILFLVSFSSIRFFSGGYHANSYFKCFAVTLVNYFLVLFIMILSIQVFYIIWLQSYTFSLNIQTICIKKRHHHIVLQPFEHTKSRKTEPTSFLKELKNTWLCKLFLFKS